MTFAGIMRAASLAFVLAVVFSGAARGAASDYEFQLLETEVPQGDGVVIAVRFIDRRTAEGVADAVIFATRLDMAPDGMETMTTKVEALPATEPGVYRFKADLAMEGGWRFSLAAKVQGETETVRGELILKAMP